MAMFSDQDLFRACQIGNEQVIPRILKFLDPSADENMAIYVASKNGHAAVVKLLLADPRVDPSADDNQAIIIASNTGYASVVKLLLADPRVDPSAKKNLAIRVASSNGHTAVVKLLLSHPKVSPISRIVQKTFGPSYLKAQIFNAATSPSGLAELMPLADMAYGPTLEMLDILISRAKAVESNQRFLHSIRLAKLFIPKKIRVSYDTYLAALFSIKSSNEVMNLVEIGVYLAHMGIPSDIFRLIVQYLNLLSDMRSF